MARKKPANQKRAPAPHPEVKAARRELSPQWMTAGIFAFAFLLYAQTISFQYALDDQPTLRDNAIVHKGFAGIPELLKTDFWHGSDIGVVVPLYRPASLILFAMEWQFFPNSPAFYHLVNVLLYAFTCALLFKLLRRMLAGVSPYIPLACVLLFAAHPLHTEVVSNIKSADELLCFLFMILASWFALNYAEKKSVPGLALSALFFFSAGWKAILAISGTYVLPAALFFFMRASALEGIPPYAESPLVNTLYSAPDWIGQRATAVYILLRYIGLLLYPHPLSYTYDFNEVKVQEPGSPWVWVSALLHVALLILALAWFRKKHVLSFAILFYLVTLAPVSNIFMTIGSPMADRFLYIPSLGFCLAVGWFIGRAFKMMEGGKPGLPAPGEGGQILPARVLVFTGLLVAGYSFKTLARSRNWENNVTLFGTDVHSTPGSASAHFHWGNALVSIVYEEAKDSASAHDALDQAAAEYKEAIRIFPGYNDAYLHLGNVYAKKSDPATAIRYFEMYNEQAGANNATVLQ